MKILQITGHATAGKDTLFNALDTLRPGLFRRYAFADELKRELDPICAGMFNRKHVKDLTASEKKIFRPVLISVGCAWREIDPLHWVKMVDKKIEWDRGMLNNDFIPVVNDTRFSNEHQYFVEKYGADQVSLIEVVRTDSTSTPPEEELKNQPFLSERANYRVEWPTLLPAEMDKINSYAEKLLKTMGL